MISQQNSQILSTAFVILTRRFRHRIDWRKSINFDILTGLPKYGFIRFFDPKTGAAGNPAFHQTEFAMPEDDSIIRNFFHCFSERDHAGMIACYHPEVRFRDEIFDLQGKQACAMWHMLCESGKDLSVSFSEINADDVQGSARWEATYTFSSGRKVHNIIQSRFWFKEGKIGRHEDRFDFWRWSRQAIGPMGLIFGWSPFLRNAVAQKAAISLSKFIKNHPEYR